jgi:hypothetical protein
VVDTKWTIKGREFVHCNCAYGCPCQFNALPTHGHCQAVAAIEIEEGHHGDTPLDGMRIAVVLRWPGPIHEGRGEALPIVDERASPAQREALLRIMSGEDTVPGATFFAVFATTYETVHEPVFTRIEFDLDVDGRTARLVVPGVIDARGEPIVNPISGETHRARINLPHGFEYDVAEIGRGWAETQGPIGISLADSHAQFAKLHITESGVIH